MQNIIQERERINWQTFRYIGTPKIRFVSTSIRSRALIKFGRSISNERSRQDSLKRLLPHYYWSRLLSNAFKLNQYEAISSLVSRENNTTLLNTSILKISYVNQTAIEDLLGDQGKYVLDKVLNLIQEITDQEKWPIIKVEINNVNDLEISKTEHVLVVLHFNTDFATANQYLYKFYSKLDLLTTSFNTKDQNILVKSLFFDVKANYSLSSR